jgi:hypothetical protein
VAKQDHKTFKVKFHSPPKQLSIRGGGKGLPHFAAELDGSAAPTPPRADEADDEPLDDDFHFVLGELLESKEPKKGEWGLLMAMGPGFCAELVLLRW